MNYEVKIWYFESIAFWTALQDRLAYSRNIIFSPILLLGISNYLQHPDQISQISR